MKIAEVESISFFNKVFCLYWEYFVKNIKQKSVELFMEECSKITKANYPEKRNQWRKSWKKHL